MLNLECFSILFVKMYVVDQSSKAAHVDIRRKSAGPRNALVQFLGEEKAVQEIYLACRLLLLEMFIVSVGSECSANRAVQLVRKKVQTNLAAVMRYVCSIVLTEGYPACDSSEIVETSNFPIGTRGTELGQSQIFRFVGDDEHQSITANNYLGKISLGSASVPWASAR
ncbi:hypothetical protein [Ruegeria sp. SCP11]|uniref:hypothetical protein n=1 Tax=Ruegeria sp. SCP11 TaxID=3141378 RepID=UPI0033377CFC